MFALVGSLLLANGVVCLSVGLCLPQLALLLVDLLLFLVLLVNGVVCCFGSLLRANGVVCLSVGACFLWGWLVLKLFFFLC